jgi:hypothetical protein
LFDVLGPELDEDERDHDHHHEQHAAAGDKYPVTPFQPLCRRPLCRDLLPRALFLEPARLAHRLSSKRVYDNPPAGLHRRA